MKKFVAILLICLLANSTLVGYGTTLNTNEYSEQAAVTVINPFDKIIISESVLLSLKIAQGTQYKVGVIFNELAEGNPIISPQNKIDISANLIAKDVLNTTKEAFEILMDKKAKVSIDSVDTSNKEIILQSELKTADSIVNFYNEELNNLREGNYLVVVEIYNNDKITSIVNKSFVVKKSKQIDAIKIRSLATKALPEKVAKQSIFKTIFRSIFGD